jgi:hypothetical protein
MARGTILIEGLRHLLIDGVTETIGQDARFIAPLLIIRRCDGTPNWDADIGIQSPALHRAFLQVLSQLQAE